MAGIRTIRITFIEGVAFERNEHKLGTNKSVTQTGININIPF